MTFTTLLDARPQQKVLICSLLISNKDLILSTDKFFLVELLYSFFIENALSQIDDFSFETNSQQSIASQNKNSDIKKQII